jgi:hypothetical protein
MSRITQPGATSPLALFQTNSNPGGTYNYVDGAFDTYVGQTFYSSDNRRFVIVQNGGTALVAGHLNCGPVSVAAHTGLTVTAFTAYSANGNVPPQVTATLASTGVLPNEYAGGYLVVATGTGIGQTLKIASHPGLTAGSASVVFTLEDSPAVALTTNSTVNLILNPFGSANGGTASSSTVTVSTNGIVVASTTASSRGQIAGVTLYAIPASTSTFPSYGLIQRSGLVAAVNDASTTKGLDLMPSSNTAGALMTYVVATSSRVGTSTETGTTTTAGLIDLQLS